jgi:hypothetical protein
MNVTKNIDPGRLREIIIPIEHVIFCKISQNINYLLLEFYPNLSTIK